MGRNNAAAGFVARFGKAYFGSELEFRVRLFNVLALGGVVIGLLMAVLGAINHTGFFNAAVNFFSAALAWALLVYSRRSGRYQVCYMLTVAVIFVALFPVMFFSTGGYHSGMPAFFVFAVVFTVFMLEGVKAVIFSVLELVVYTAVCLVAYMRPDTVHQFSTENEMLTDIVVAFVTVSVILGVIMFIHFRMYNEQQKKLDEQNKMLARVSRAKTEFLANSSHEMRTPLTVISVNVQTVMTILKNLSVKDTEAGELLQSAQSEVMRLARMVGGMLTLASMSETTDRQELDLTTLLESSADMLRLTIQKRENTLTTELEPGLFVFGNADLLTQVVSNLLQNAGAHTESGSVRLTATKIGGEIYVTLRDTGTGISPELLPHVFERGVSDGGTGFGLYLCKTVVESHGGRIWLESEQGRGTTASFTLPVYGGQFGGAGI
jgi:signal transduction histidine kinase